MITNEFWLDRWKTGRIGFHQEGVNPKLIEFWPTLPKGSRVLVPLCGKSNDMIWLAEQGYQVTGVELSSLAVIQFLGDNDLTYETHQEGELKIHTVNGLPLRIVEGDYFLFNETEFDACYDRAAMVAMPDSKRAEYVAHTLERLTLSACLLLISLRYDGEEQGPPFSVDEDSISTLWGQQIQRIACENLAQTNPTYKEQGHVIFEESVWRIQP
ncbi:thiopurine S-methyltransferase [Marinomonas sp. M1K-6]|uniref:Thiopurine S-methyltransferase n=1 Tax=Marinomonas profundi TaxID=2726122 RepID=A0A847QVC7_9GAMM|nr:thiopurine S-methyltransferase [Marinomonas profundi]NLQ16838.1 thiopurine S-methyltransferase [Marinomonas profundi]UDV02569.1 thiopurine S-methyltransferase [Marinomonas profundi]